MEFITIDWHISRALNMLTFLPNEEAKLNFIGNWPTTTPPLPRQSCSNAINCFGNLYLCVFVFIVLHYNNFAADLV